MGAYHMEADSEKCAGCLRCQLACSDLHEKQFIPSRARIHVELWGDICSIRFTDECTECGVCADHCFYDALQKTKKVKDQ